MKKNFLCIGIKSLMQAHSLFTMLHSGDRGSMSRNRSERITTGGSMFSDVLASRHLMNAESCT